MARNKGAAPFSLFAFQDAITSVCGVVILITLLLALELTRRVVDDGAPPGVSAAAYERAKDEVETLKKNIDAANAAVDATAEFSEEVAGLSLEEAQQQAKAVETRLDAARAMNEQLKEEREEAKNVESATNALAEKNEELENALAETEESIKDARSKIASAEDGRVYFEYDYRATEKPWFVDIADKRIVVLGGKGEEEYYTSYRSFLSWARKRPRATEYFVLIARPSGASNFAKIMEELEETHRIGIDLVGETQELAIMNDEPESKEKSGGDEE